MGHDDVLGIKRTCPGAWPGQALLSGQAASRPPDRRCETGIVFVAGLRFGGAVVFAVFAGHRADPAGGGRRAGASIAASCSSGVSRKSAPG